MSAILRFPDFRYKAFTLSYDDGTVHDKRLSDMFFKHGVRATFNISASFLGKDGRLTEEEVRERDALRKQYLAAVRRNIDAQLEKVQIVETDGSKHKLKKKTIN